MSHFRIQAVCILCGLALSLTLPAWASYQPPRSLSAPSSSSTTTTGRRSSDCQGNTPAGLMTLAPHSHVGQTISAHPTFAWFVPEDRSLPIEFYLYAVAPTGDEQLVYQTDLNSTAGVMSLSLPQTQPDLPPGRYRWQVVLLCDPDSPSNAIVADAEIQVVTPPALEASLAGVSNPIDRANRLAEAGLWYDAIALLTTDSTRSAQLALLSDLAAIEANQGNADYSSQLRSMIQLER